MESTTDTSTYLIDKSKKMKKDNDDILELVYQQLVDADCPGPDSSGPPPAPVLTSSAATAESSSSTSSAVDTVKPSDPSPTPSPGPSSPSTASGDGSDVWAEREKAVRIIEFILTYALSKEFNATSPTITAPFEDTMAFQKFMLAIEGDMNHIIAAMKEHWGFFSDVEVEVDWEQNRVTIKRR